MLVVKNKLFAFGTSNTKVFDKTCWNFVALKIKHFDHLDSFDQAIAVGNKIVVFKSLCPNILEYDVDKNEWVSCGNILILKDLAHYFCVKIPRF